MHRCGGKWGEVMMRMGQWALAGPTGLWGEPGFHESEAVFGERVASLRHPAPRLPGTSTNF